jgi:serine/threonine protein kinase
MMPMMIRQFELRSVVGSGGMGTVYRAWDTTLERMVAVKLMRKELLADQIALESFYREARACARLNHTNIVHIYAFDEWEGQQYLVMELADRGSLDARWTWRSNTICSTATSSRATFCSTRTTNRSWWTSAWHAKPMWNMKWKM